MSALRLPLAAAQGQRPNLPEVQVGIVGRTEGEWEAMMDEVEKHLMHVYEEVLLDLAKDGVFAANSVAGRYQKWLFERGRRLKINPLRFESFPIETSVDNTGTISHLQCYEIASQVQTAYCDAIKKELGKRVFLGTDNIEDIIKTIVNVQG